MKWDPLSRRHLLQGVGASLALPLLPSLLSKSATAQTAAPQKTFIGFQAMNGLYRMTGPQAELMPPTPWELAPLLARGFTRIDVPPRHPVYHRPLSSFAQENGQKISQIID